MSIDRQQIDSLAVALSRLAETQEKLEQAEDTIGELKHHLGWALSNLPETKVSKDDDGKLRRWCQFCEIGYIIDFKGRKPIEHQSTCPYDAAADARDK